MALTQKEMSLLKDLKSQEKLCVEKYTKCAQQATDQQLQTMFTQLAQMESRHLQTLEQIESGTVPQMQSGSGQQQQQQQQQPMATSAVAGRQTDKQNDAFLCSDLLGTEKFVSSSYNTCIFEFANPAIRQALNHIQKEEQEHGEKLYSYMAQNGMYS